MKFFLSLMVLSCSCIALAQSTEEPSLFPTLSGFTDEETVTKTDNDTIGVKEQTETISSSNETILEEETEEDLFKEPAPPQLNQTEVTPETGKETVEEEEDNDDDKQQRIYITIDDVQATLTPNRNASFCSAAFAVVNGLKKELKAFSGNFTIGSMTKEFKFNNVAKEQAAALKYMFIGTSCEEILNQPAYTITKCEVEGWSEKKCKNKVQFIAIPKQENTLE